jgi:mannose-1-phosphate guanylyltransferase
VVDGVVRRVRPGDVVSIIAGQKHTIIADSELKVIEAQLGRDIRVSDKTKFDFDFDKM